MLKPQVTKKDSHTEKNLYKIWFRSKLMIVVPPSSQTVKKEWFTN